MRKIVLSLALTASAFTAAACIAQDMPAAGASQTRAQGLAQADARFAQMDSNHDGLIGATEMQAYRAAIHDRMIARGGDAPGDGEARSGRGRFSGPDGEASMTKAAFEARAADRFDRTDTNHDGVIDATERANRAGMRKIDRRDRRGDTAPAPAPAPAPAN